MTYPKRLIEVDLPIKRISAHARREKSIRHGHISTLHIWWARRPLAACRAVICASLWPDPADPNCPQSFRDEAAKHIIAFAKASQSAKWGAEICDNGSFSRYMRLAHGGDIDPTNLEGQTKLRALLFDFIADFAAWEASTNHWFLDTARALTQAAHEALGGEKGTRPLVVDPFAGGGAIPLEALRVGADAFASDLNPVAVLLNKVMLECVPSHGIGLADQVRTWGKWVKDRVDQQLADLYPRDADGAAPIAYLWARIVQCEGPSCGAVIPLISSPWLSRKADNQVAVRLVPHASPKRVTVEILVAPKLSELQQGTVKRASATCPCCGYTTPAHSVRAQLRARRGGSSDAYLLAVVCTRPGQQGRFYRLPAKSDYDAVKRSEIVLASRRQDICGDIPLIPDELTPEGKGGGAGRAFSQRLYGMETFADVYTPRQLVALTTFVKVIRDLPIEVPQDVRFLLSFALGRVNDLSMSLCRWLVTIQAVSAANGGQNRMPVPMDFVEANPIGGSGGDWLGQVDWVARVTKHLEDSRLPQGRAQRARAQDQTLPDDSVDAVVTDPPYYDAFPYSDLSDFFFVWLRRCLGASALGYADRLVPKDDEIVVYDVVHGKDGRIKDDEFFQREMRDALSQVRIAAKPSAIGIVVFANKTTAGWESLLNGLVDAGWIVTGSWPVDTERPTRQRAIGSAALSSSVHLVCRPREVADGSSAISVGDWRDILAELPKRIHDWMARLAGEGVVGADAIFACLGPALEIFSRYSRVEKASGEQVPLKDYLTHVWGAVSQEALAQIFKDADATGFEEDARLTAMWLWTLNAGGSAPTEASDTPAEDSEADTMTDDEEDGDSGGKSKGGGYVLEYDAARKIAQGLGAHLEQLSSVIEVKGDKARLLGVAERTRRLFGKDEADTPKPNAKKKDKQLRMFSLDEIEAEDAGQGGWGDKSVPKLGDTVLDRIHQSMILFAASRGEALRRFLVEDGAGRDQRFWKLAQALSALYPQGTDEKRWVDGVLARKKGLGL